MRTTVTLDPDVVRLLEQAMTARGQSFKEALNHAVRRGLADVVDARPEDPFVVTPRPMGLRTGVDPARLNALADELEIEAFQETGRTLNASSAGTRRSDP